MVFVTYYFAYGRHGLLPSESTHMDVRIHRISMIPSPMEIHNNLTSWGSGWNGSLSVTEFYIRDNHLSVNYATLVMIFFAISAVFHFGACIAGAFERCWCATPRKLLLQHAHLRTRVPLAGSGTGASSYATHRSNHAPSADAHFGSVSAGRRLGVVAARVQIQTSRFVGADLDLRVVRWVEYSGSASVMAMTISISIGKHLILTYTTLNPLLTVNANLLQEFENRTRSRAS